MRNNALPFGSSRAAQRVTLSAIGPAYPGGRAKPNVPGLVAAQAPGHLVITPGAKDRDVLAPIKTSQNKIGDFVREVVTDEKFQPNHGWRHRFKTIATVLGVTDVPNAIQDWAPGRSVSASYGDVTITAKANAIAEFPRYVIDRGL